MIVVRSETEADHEAIFELTRTAFADHQFSSHTEHFIIDRLRRAGALSVSLVAQKQGAVAGHIAFSPVAISDGSSGWYGLGPVSVLPELQGAGIGTLLVNAGLNALKARGAQGCVVVGEPRFYTRFGFRRMQALVLEEIPPEYFMAVPLGREGGEDREGREVAAGSVAYHEAFAARE